MTKQLKKIASVLFILILSFSNFTQANNISDKISAKNTKQYTEQFIIGGQPTETDLDVLAENGIKTIINLRAIGEFTDFNEKVKVESLGMIYISIPIGGAEGINKENLALFSQAIKVKNKAFVHCASGNRVGAMFALDAHFNHQVNIEEAIVVGKSSGLTRLEDKVREVISNN